MDKPSREGHRLTEVAEELYADWRCNFNDCSCHLSPPCNGCVHPGHPLNLDQDDYWERDE